MTSLVTINGWYIYAHPLFLDQLEEQERHVLSLKNRNPENFTSKNATKRLIAMKQLAFEIIPEDPTRAIYRQGAGLGEGHRHWFRAKFFQQYRLFFRFSSSQKAIIYGWVNDDKTKRAYGSQNDAYRVFQKMLESGNPPDSWEDLMEEARESARRLKKLVSDGEE